jgi:CheY-like chemotaxis protein
VHHLLSEALEASSVAKELTHKLITFAKGGKPLTRVVALGPILRAATEFTLSGANVGVEFQIAEDLWPVKADADQLGQAIHTLVMNAREAMPEGGVISVAAQNVRTAETTTEPGADALLITIRDTGHGIPGENLERVFDPYFTTKVVGEERGLGLGLSICRSIVHQHGGEISISSRVDRGTAVEVLLPVSRGETPAALPAVPQPAPAEALRFGKGRVLVMDDEARIREMIGEMLGFLGYEAALCASGEDAIALYRKELDAGRPFDLVILDLTIRGGMGGKDTIRALTAIDPGVKAIVSSGYSQDPVMAAYDRYGFIGIMAKPYTIGQLSTVLESSVHLTPLPRPA